MSKKTIIFILLIFLCGNTFSQSNVRDKEVIDFRFLLNEMISPEKLAKWPRQEWENMQSSALKTDKRKNKGFFSGKEIGNFIRIEEKGNGRKEWVLMEHKGPGTIIRMWSPNMAKDAIFRVYFDGSDKPAIEVNMMKLFYGEDFVPPPFAALKARGGNVYLPIPFERGCKVTIDKNDCGWAEPADLFYIVQYRAYTPGTPVQTFDMKQYKANRKYLDEAGRVLKTPGVETNALEILTDTFLDAGQELIFDLKKGGTAINYLDVKIEAKDMADALRTTKLIMEFDSIQTIDCPFGDFFGSGAGLNPFGDWMRTVKATGEMSCRWVMPYEKSAKLKVKSGGSQSVKLRIKVNYQPWQWDDQSMYFFASWGFDRGINSLPVSNFNFINIQGRGLYVGETLSITNFSTRWWGEGVEKISIDGETFPSQFGTGTEDYYGYAWGDPSIFDAPFHAQPRVPEGPEFFGTTVNTRIRSLDAIPFNTSLNLDMEVLTQGAFVNEFSELDYGVATFWYGFKESKGNWNYDSARTGD